MIDPIWLKARADDVLRADAIDPALYARYSVKRGLRNEDGTGVLVGLTTIGNVHGYVVDEGEKQAVAGQLFYRGIDVNDLVAACAAERRFGYEEAAYLLLFGCRTRSSSPTGAPSWRSIDACRKASRKTRSSAGPART